MSISHGGRYRDDLADPALVNEFSIAQRKLALKCEFRSSASVPIDQYGIKIHKIDGGQDI